MPSKRRLFSSSLFVYNRRTACPGSSIALSVLEGMGRTYGHAVNDGSGDPLPSAPARSGNGGRRGGSRRIDFSGNRPAHGHHGEASTRREGTSSLVDADCRTPEEIPRIVACLEEGRLTW